jgi:hypothetical protein
MDCYKHFEQNIQFAKNGQWDQLQSNSCEDPECYYCGVYKYSILFQIVIREEFTQEMEETVYRICGPLSSPKWMEMLIHAMIHRQHRPSLPAIRYLLENGRILPNETEPATLLQLYMSVYQPQHIEYLTSPEVNISINLPNVNGTTPLLTYLRTAYNDQENLADRANAPDGWRQTLLGHVERFLQMGADPLLENKEGTSPLSYAKELVSFTPQEKEDLIQLLTRYA